MATINVKNNEMTKGSQILQCYFCRKPTSYVLEEVNGFQVNEKYMCKGCMTQLIQSFRRNVPNVLFAELESMCRTGDFKELVEITRRYDPYITELKDTITSLKEDIVQMSNEIATQVEKILNLQNTIDTKDLQIANNEIAIKELTNEKNEYENMIKLLNNEIEELSTKLKEITNVADTDEVSDDNE